MKKYNIKIHGTEYAVSIDKVEGKVAQVTLNGIPYEVEVEGLTTVPTRVVPKKIQPPTLQSETPVARPSSSSVPTTAYPQKSPLPGIVLEVLVREGDTIKAGQTLMVLEAMKMENNIEADKGGVIEKVNIHKGDSVLEGDVLFSIK
jgi:Acetyl/propionyl-CoA carboxylase, alpha subunit